MSFFDKKFSDGLSWDTKLDALEEEAFLVSIGAILAVFLIIEVRLEILILLVEIMNELEA